ncbi:uncharacterized protein LOC113522796 [Galleria mellonella]|uniref:Uncharacterized protein LOC113522796 n=1 Tax=Galleria mellonella TaxID=7137 RepID=A0A6J1X912_GALME|nr:uncharacterized protein LOC113522796 [Galleria mellonella]
METFIKGVRSQPCLWNPLHPDYREMQVRDNAWQHVVKLCNNSSIPNIKAARNEWKKLRDNHREALKRAKLGQNKLLPAQITTWKYAKAMQFLEPHMKYRITENIEMDSPDGTPSKSVEQDISTTEIPELGSRGSPKNKKRCSDCFTDKSSHLNNTDALESFFNCMLKSTRQMPLWMQTQVKKKIFGIIIDAEEQLSSDQIDTKDESNYFMINKIKPEVFSEDSYDS